MKKFFMLLFAFIMVFTFAERNVTIIHPEKGSIVLQKTFWGIGKSEDMVNVFSKFPGRLIKMYKKEGDFVKKGDILYKLDRELTGMKYNYIEKKSPITGVIVKKSASTGQFVNPGMPIYMIVDVKNTTVIVSILPSEVNEFKNAKSITLLKNGKKYSGHFVNEIPFGDPMTGMISIKLKFDNVNILPNERVEISIVSSEKKGLILPIEAVLKDNHGYYVFKDVNGVAKKIYVQVGIANDKNILVKSGINSNDSIIFIGAHIVKNNETVNVIK